MRLLLLALAAVPVFTGFTLPFVISGMIGLMLGGVLIIIGAALLWFVERRSRSALQADTALNHVLKADGENLLDRDGA